MELYQIILCLILLATINGLLWLMDEHDIKEFGLDIHKARNSDGVIVGTHSFVFESQPMPGFLLMLGFIWNGSGKGKQKEYERGIVFGVGFFVIQFSIKRKLK